MTTRTKSILFALTALLLFASMLQKSLNWPKLRPLKGVEKEKTKPALTFQNYFDGNFQSQTEAHMKQSFGFRPPLIRLYNQYLWDFYGKTPVTEGQVLFGKDGWMFEPWVVADHYQWQFSHYAADSAQMAHMLSEEAQRVLRLQEILDAQGIKLFVCQVPAKDLVYPEYLPENWDHRYDDKPKISARFFNEEEYNRLGVNHLNLERWFLQIKDTADFMLFPKTGTHWSRYAALQGADTLIRYMEHLGGINMHNLVIGPRYLHNAIDPDDDLESLMNLMRPLPKPKYYYADVKVDDDTTATKPKMIVVGDSFWWNIALQLPLEKIFSDAPYWFYNHTVYYDTRYGSVDEIDLAKELLSADFIVLFYCAPEQYRMNNGFTNKAIAVLENIDKKELDSMAFFGHAVQRNVSLLRESPFAMSAVRVKARKQSQDVGKTLHDEAERLVSYQMEQGLLKRPETTKETTTNLEDHGIQ